MGDRTPSQFYTHLRKLTPSLASDDLVLATWKKHFPANTQYVLTALRITETNALIKVVDNIHGRHLEAGSTQIATAWPLLLPRDVPGPRDEVPFSRYLESETGLTTTTNTKWRFTVADVNTRFIGVGIISARHTRKTGDLRHRDDRMLNACIVPTGIHRRISKTSRNICTGLITSGRRFTPHRNDKPADAKLPQPHTKMMSEVVRSYVQQKNFVNQFQIKKKRYRW